MQILIKILTIWKNKNWNYKNMIDGMDKKEKINKMY